jgi:hypothetical protein
VGRCPKRKVSARAAGVKVSAHAARVICSKGTRPVPQVFGQVIVEKGRKYHGFRTAALRMARSLRLSLTHLMTVMAFETEGTFDTGWYKETKTVGLIQWTPKGVEEMNKAIHPDVTLDYLAALPPTKQLDYVGKYLKHQRKTLKNKLTRIEDLYLSVLWPDAVGIPDDKPFRPIGHQADDLYVPGTDYMTRARVREVLRGWIRKGLGKATTYCVSPSQEPYV